MNKKPRSESESLPIRFQIRVQMDRGGVGCGGGVGVEVGGGGRVVQYLRSYFTTSLANVITHSKIVSKQSIGQIFFAK